MLEIPDNFNQMKKREANTVEVVRCKECKYYQWINNTAACLKHMDSGWQFEDYCSYGERIE